MPSLDDLKKRIKSVKSTQKITKAMKMVAAAKLRKAQENAERSRPYSQKMQNIILNLTKTIKDTENAPKLLVGTGQDKTYLCVVLTADRGLCGGFNTNICKLAKTNFERIIGDGKNLKIITVGSKGLDQIKREYGTIRKPCWHCEQTSRCIFYIRVFTLESASDCCGGWSERGKEFGAGKRSRSGFSAQRKWYLYETSSCVAITTCCEFIKTVWCVSSQAECEVLEF